MKKNSSFSFLCLGQNGLLSIPLTNAFIRTKDFVLQAEKEHLPLNSFNIEKAMITSNESLSQNIPNPYTNSTIIKYSLPAKYASAQIIISDKSGRVLNKQSVSGTGRSSIIFNASTLAAGAYQYSLYINGRLIDTKQMVLAR